MAKGELDARPTDARNPLRHSAAGTDLTGRRCLEDGARRWRMWAGKGKGEVEYSGAGGKKTAAVARVSLNRSGRSTARPDTEKESGPTALRRCSCCCAVFLWILAVCVGLDSRCTVHMRPRLEWSGVDCCCFCFVFLFCFLFFFVVSGV